jgi:hypothetical protein
MVRAGNGIVTVLCLGADAVLSLIPKSGCRILETCESQSLTTFSENAMAVDSFPQPDQDHARRSSLSRTVVQSDIVKTEGNEDRVTLKKLNHTFIVTLVHGDAVIFIGDDFEVFGVALSFCCNSSEP